MFPIDPSTRQNRRNRPRVVVVGGGFAGLAAVRRLRRENVDVTLIDQHAYNTFQPLLYQVATATLNPGDVTWALRSVHSRRFSARFILGGVAGIDHERRQLTLDDERLIPYDYLIICTGVVVNYFGIEGAREHSFPLYTRGQALALRDELQRVLELASRHGQPEELRVVIVGAGATGVETTGAMAEMRERDLPVLFPELECARIHITLVEKSPHVLGPFQRESREYAADALRERGAELRLGTSVETVTEDGVTISSDDGPAEFLPAQIVVWASGIVAPDRIGQWGMRQGKGGRLLVDDRLRVLGHPRVFAAGDIAVIEEDPLPQQAQPAIQTGNHAAGVIANDVEGRPTSSFEYRDLGSLATIGRRDAVAEATHLPRLTGLPAWIAWNVVHIRALLGGRNRLAAIVNLGSKYLLWPRDHNLIVGDPTITDATNDQAVDR